MFKGYDPNKPSTSAFAQKRRVNSLIKEAMLLDYANKNQEKTDNNASQKESLAAPVANEAFTSKRHQRFLAEKHYNESYEKLILEYHTQIINNSLTGILDESTIGNDFKRNIKSFLVENFSDIISNENVAACDNLLIKRDYAILENAARKIANNGMADVLHEDDFTDIVKTIPSSSIEAISALVKEKVIAKIEEEKDMAKLTKPTNDDMPQANTDLTDEKSDGEVVEEQPVKESVLLTSRRYKRHALEETPSFFKLLMESVMYEQKILAEAKALVENANLTEGNEPVQPYINMDKVFMESVIVYTMLESFNTAKLIESTPAKMQKIRLETNLMLEKTRKK